MSDFFTIKFTIPVLIINSKSNNQAEAVSVKIRKIANWGCEKNM